jgi:aminopeptidase N
MRRRLLVPALVGLVVLPASLAGAVPYDAGMSTPVEDSYYPAKGEPSVDALHYGLSLRWDPQSRLLRGRARIRLRVARADSGIRLDLSDRLRVRRVVVDGRARRFTHRGHHLVVHTPVEQGQRHTVRVMYRGTPGPVTAPGTRRDSHRVGMRVTHDGQLRTMQEPYGAFTWYPVNDQPSDKALYDLRVNAPRGWVGVSNGRLAARRTTPRRTVTTWTNRAPMSSYLVTLAVGPYRHYRQTGPHGLPINYWVPRHRPALLRPLRIAPAALRWLERRLGRYPFDRISFVVVPGDSAMETQTTITMGAGEYHFGLPRVRAVVVHELAHQWYGDTITPTDWRDLWMNEGMATYLHSRWVASRSRNPIATWRHTVTQWRRDDQFYRNRYGPPGAYHHDEFGSSNVYYPVALMWETLRLQLGDRRFHDLVRAWPQTHRNSNANRAQMIDWIETRTQTELSAFFHQWLMATKSPA